MRRPTYKQRSFIKAICKELKVSFKGDFYQAMKFISNHIDEFYKHKEIKQMLIKFLKMEGV